MSRRGFGGRGRGGSRGGRASFGGFEFSSLSVTYQEVMNITREPEEAYPPIPNPSSLADVTETDRKAAQYQHRLLDRLHRSQYHLVEETKKQDFARYSDKFRPATHPQLSESDLNPDYFPSDLWQRYFNPKKPAVSEKAAARRKKVRKINLEDIGDDDGEDKDGSDDDEDDDDAELDEYEDEDDDDYNENYFETGSQEDLDEFADGGGGGDDYD